MASLFAQLFAYCTGFFCAMQDRRSHLGAPVISLSKNLVEFAPAGAKKVRSFSSATCAAKKILLRLQVWNLCAGGAQIMRAADCSPFVKKYYFLTVSGPAFPFGSAGPEKICVCAYASICCVTQAICASTLGTDVPPKDTRRVTQFLRSMAAYTPSSKRSLKV